MPTGTRPLPGPLSIEVARLISAAIASSGARQGEVATAAKMSAAQLSRVLAGTKVFTLDQLDAVCAALDVEIADVLTKADRKTRDRHRGSNVIDGRFGDVAPTAEDAITVKQPPTRQRTAAKKGTRKADQAPFAE